MFCKNCGKELGEGKFCQYCGTPVDGECHVTVVTNPMIDVAKIKEAIKKMGYDKLLKIISAVSFVITLILRFVKNEIEVVYSLLAQDDYYVMSGSGKTICFVIIIIQILLSLFVWNIAKKENASIDKKTIISIGVALLLQILVILLRLPSPY